MKLFSSIKWKLSLMCALCVTLIMTVVCGAHIFSVVYTEKQAFTDAVNKVFTSEFLDELSTISKTVDYTVDGSGTVSAFNTDNAKRIYDAVWAYSGELGINSDRIMCVLDESGTPVYSTSEDVIKNGLPKTSSLISALNGGVGHTSSVARKYSDYAVALNDSKNIVYVKDNGNRIYASVSQILILYLICLLFGIVASFVAGLYVAGSVTIPLNRLNVWAKELANGNIDADTEIVGHDELFELSESLVNMAHKLDATSTEAKNEKKKLDTILQSMTDGLLAFNTKGELIHYNKEAKRLLGRNYLDDIEFDKFFKEINVGITIGDLLYMNHPNTEKSVVINKEKYINMNFRTFKLNGKAAGIVVVLHDMTRLEKLEESRRLFVADVSHELRTPITTIKSYAETLIDSSDPEDDFRIRFTRVIASEADRMARLISDLLTLSALDDKHASYKLPEPIDVKEIVSNVVDRFQISASKKDQQLLYNPINEVPIITGDPDALERVIINIVNNAIKYTEDGGKIDVYTSCVYNDICIKVVDNGIGIPEENLPHLFDRFYRVDKARARDTGGTGLGLAIAKQTIESGFNGKIKITSEVGKGTEVSITIPVTV